jgi:hypothetical protein
MLGVFNPTMTPSVQCLRYFTALRYMYVICHFWTPVCNAQVYWRRRSVCYTSLFTTPLVVTTISVYSVLWPSGVVSLSGPLISSVICSVISLQCPYLGVSFNSVFSVCGVLSSISFLCLFLSSVSSLLCSAFCLSAPEYWLLTAEFWLLTAECSLLTANYWLITALVWTRLLVACSLLLWSLHVSGLTAPDCRNLPP